MGGKKSLGCLKAPLTPEPRAEARKFRASSRREVRKAELVEEKKIRWTLEKNERRGVSVFYLLWTPGAKLRIKLEPLKIG